MQDPVEIAEIKKQYKGVIYVDIDSTICKCPDDTEPSAVYKQPDYALCTPHPNRVDKINRLYDEGHYILYWTARGTCTGIDWTELTTKQLNSWGCRYHRLIVKKPYYDLFIDDKNVNSEVFFAQVD